MNSMDREMVWNFINKIRKITDPTEKAKLLDILAKLIDGMDAGAYLTGYFNTDNFNEDAGK